MNDIVMQNEKTLVSGNWWIEEDKAYFCGTVLNAIFCVHLNSLQYDLVAWIPEDIAMDVGLNPYCIKRKDCIFCLPGTGRCVWCYNMYRRDWEKIEIEHDAQLYLYNKNLYRNMNSIIWLMEDDTGKIIQINLDKKEIQKEYYLSDSGVDDVYGECIFLHNKLYCVVKNTIKCIDLNHGEMITYEAEGFKSNLFTICYDGTNFWLSGYCKEIYVWNPEQGIVKVITDFPEQFGFYHFSTNSKAYIDCNSYCKEDDPFFYESVLLGKYVWFISSQSSSIIYVDRNTYEANQLYIKAEEETTDSLKREFACKYLFEYVRAERYIGLYSIKNHCIFEIDTIELCVENRDYRLSNAAVFAIANAYGYNKEKKIFRETKEIDSICFSEILKQNITNTDILMENIGETIYCYLNS